MTSLGFRTVECREQLEQVLVVAARAIELPQGERIDISNGSTALHTLYSMSMRSWCRRQRSPARITDCSDAPTASFALISFAIAFVGSPCDYPPRRFSRCDSPLACCLTACRFIDFGGAMYLTLRSQITNFAAVLLLLEPDGERRCPSS